MEKIILQNTLPDVFRDESSIKSDIWLQEVVFEKGRDYLIQANSGTGKSSLCSYIYGYRLDYSGKILFDQMDVKGVKLADWDAIRKYNLSLLFQELNLFSELTAFENVLLKNNLTHFKSEKEIGQMFEQLGIANRKDTLVARMSWGQQQRVAAIRCLCQPFDFLIVDEPVSHLDDDNATIMAKMLKNEARQQGASIIVTSIGKHLPLDYTKTYSL